MEDMKKWALMYADLDFAVFPLLENSKRPATTNGLKSATTNKAQIEAWWTKHPRHNIGIATGKPSGGIVVIDLDIDEEKGKNGYETLKEWQKEHGELPETWTSITGRGGYHFFYKDSASNKCKVELYEGVDVRGDGGYVVAPPSIHENGRCYEWETGPGDGIDIMPVNSTVADFLAGPAKEWTEPGYQVPEVIPEGGRVSALIQLIGSSKAKGVSDDGIKALIIAENNKKCNPPLTEEELAKEVFPALQRGWETTNPYYKASVDDGKVRPIKNHSLDMTGMSEASEEEPEWLIKGHIPRYQITAMVGDGGSGKTTTWCAIVAAISSGKRPFLLGDPGGIDLLENEPQKVLFFSAEDSYKYTLRRRLRKNGANLNNILTIDIADERFQDIKFDNPFLERLIEKHRPGLVVFDPVQAFIPPNIRMGERNAMRSCISPLIGISEKYKTTFLIIVHTNKQSGVWGRKRMADSSDMWDISRSVEMVGETDQQGIRYISQEKSNYGRIMPTVLFSIDDEVVTYKGLSNKKDKDYIQSNNYAINQAPQRDEAKEFILDFLKDGEKEVSELDAMAKAMSISKSTIRRAKEDLKQAHKIKYRTVSLGKGKGTKFYISLIASENVS